MKTIDLYKLRLISKKCRYDIVRMIDGAGSGHIGGSLSSIDIYVSLLSVMGEDDRLVVSHGHSSAALYAALGNTGRFDIEEAVAGFRRKPPFEGHPSVKVNGVEWCSGALGQGLSVGCGFALAKKIKGENGRVYVVMGDGEQEKGQLQEAREFAVKFGLDNLTAVIDCNGLQASGNVSDICAQPIEEKYSSSGWRTLTVDGHCFDELCGSFSKSDMPTCILAKTVMGKGIAEIENDYRYHGTLIEKELRDKALAELALTDGEAERILPKSGRKQKNYEAPVIPLYKGREYKIGDTVDVRSAMGNALSDIAAENPDVYIAAVDCDLEGSVKLSDFKKQRGKAFIECGIAEQNGATVAASMAKSGIIAIHADFSVFNIGETYSQNRMADINNAPIKLFCTHAGLDVGEDGKTHQCIDYISLLSNLYGFKVIVPADANQADAAVRYAMSVSSPVAVIAGRSKMPVLTSENGAPLTFEYGKCQWLRHGEACAVITYGNMVHRALEAYELLLKDGIRIGVLNIASPLDFDEASILEAAKTGIVITYEDHNVKSGISGAVARVICENGGNCRLKAMGIEHYGSSSSPDNLYREQGLDANALIGKIKEML